jgi:hypothetical protein
MLFLDPGNPDGYFDRHVMPGVLAVNLILVIIETYYDLNDYPEPSWTENLEFVFSFVYLGECMFKIAAKGWPFYRSSTSNLFDLGTTFLLLGTSVAESLLSGVKNGSFSTYANILRLFRLLRVVKQLKGIERVQFMVSTVMKLVLKSQEMLTLLSVVIYGFTVVSVQLFGGLLYEENPQLQETDYFENKEFVLNFNDHFMAFGLWFVALLCEYKPSFPEAIDETSAIPCAWLISPLFWAFAVCITFELVKAFTIEVYLVLDGKQKEAQQEKDKGEVRIPGIILTLEEAEEALGLQFWYKCLAVDEDEYEVEVRKEVAEILEGKTGEEHEEGEEEEEDEDHQEEKK